MNLFLWFLSAQLLIGLAYLLARTFINGGKFSHRLRLHYALFALAFGVLFIQFLIPVGDEFKPILKWADSIDLSKNFVPPITNHFTPLTPKTLMPQESSWIAIGATLATSHGLPAILLILALFGFKFVRDLQQLRQMREGGFRVKKIGKLEILAHDQIPIPLAFRTFGRAVIVIPTPLLAKPEDYKISVLHEVQHHRQGDPLWMYAIEVLRIFSWLNPLARMWIREIAELQEFACDETLVDRSRVNSRRYARCLLEVAQSSLQSKFAPACATGLLFRMERQSLKRRITMLLQMKDTVVNEVVNSQLAQTRSKLSLWPKMGAMALILMSAAYATKGIAQTQVDRTYTLSEAVKLSGAITGAEGIPIQINAEVVAELNRYLGTPAARQSMREALARRTELYQRSVHAMLDQYQLPRALDAVPMIESRYQNLADRNSEGWGAGLWMFIAPTARRMGLAVNDRGGRTIDERLNVQKLTDAAGRLLKGNQMFYNDLGLSLLAYNWGERTVDKYLGSTLSRDAWVLSRAKGDPYLAQLMAAMIMIANPKIAE